MKRYSTVAILLATLAVMAACSSDPEPTATAVPTETPPPTISPDLSAAIPDAAEVDRKTAMLLGIDLHRQLWSTRPTSNYKFGFQWNVGDYAYQRANVQVRVIKGEISEVRWADNAVKTDGTEPEGFVVPDEPNIEDYYSIDDLFEVISDAIDSDPGQVTLGFDSVFGFPTNVSIEFAPDSPHKDVSFFAAQLVPIPGPPE
ncbi:MAG: hypothetical protein J4N66_04495 [Chloroflexi bacterium]|nr:hypothetical protein [Chloroflexota bacterium]